jgi:CHAT domain-containing protein
VVGVSRARDLPRTREHTQELQNLKPDWKNRAWLVADRVDSLLDLMRSKQPHVVYLYCHGSGRPVGASEFPMLYLGENPQEAKPGEWFERSMLRGEVQWTKPRPLVFLNGCHTTVLDARTTLDFVTGFVQNANACGVVGTEVTVFEPLAGAFARRFMDRFLGGTVVGQAVRDARLDLLREGNPLGLVYTPFVLSGTQLVRAEA